MGFMDGCRSYNIYAGWIRPEDGSRSVQESELVDGVCHLKFRLYQLNEDYIRHDWPVRDYMIDIDPDPKVALKPMFTTLRLGWSYKTNLPKECVSIVILFLIYGSAFSSPAGR